MDTPLDQSPRTLDLSQGDIVSCEDVVLEHMPSSPEVKFLSGLQTSISLIHSEQVKYRLSPNSVEPLTRETFGALLESYQEQSKSLIVAVILERDVEEPTTIRPFFFEAGMLNKLIFKRSGDTLISRYSGSTALTPNNPLTNIPIIGEIEYYICRDSYTAIFLGSDYTLWKRASLQEVFQNNSQLSPDEWESLQDSIRLNDLDATSLEALARLVDVHRASILSVIRIPFLQSAAYGIFLFLMGVIYAAAFALALEDVSSTQYVELKLDWDSEISFSVLAVVPMMAVSSSLFDWLTCTLFQEKESPAIFQAKIVTWLLLVLATPVAYFIGDDKQGKLSYLCAVMGYAAYHVLYSACLFLANCKYHRPE